MIAETVVFREAVSLDATVRLMLDEDSAVPIGNCLPQARIVTDTVALLLGPEGGWTDEERTTAHEKGWMRCSLGATVLRAETAATAGIAVARAYWAGSSS